MNQAIQLIAWLTLLLQEPVEPDPPPPPPPPLPIVIGGDLLLDLDLETGEVRVAPAGERDRTLVRFPLTTRLRPGIAPLEFEVDAAVEPMLIPSSTMVEGRRTLKGAVFHASHPEVEAAVTVGVRPGLHGAMFVFSLPRSVLAAASPRPAATRPAAGQTTVDRTPSGTPISIAGTKYRRGVSMRVPERLVLPADRFEEFPSGSLRFHGRVGIDDASVEGGAASLSITAGGEVLFESELVRSGVGERDEGFVRFDVPMPPRASEVAIRIEPSSGDSVMVDLIESGFRGARRSISLRDLVRSGEEGIDFFVGGADGEDAGPGFGDLLPLPVLPDVARDGVTAVDARDPGAFTPSPPLLLFDTSPHADAPSPTRFLGIGVGYLPDATVLAFEGDGIALNLPTYFLGQPFRDGEESDDAVQVLLVLIAGDSRSQLLERYRESLVSVSAAPVVRAVGSITVPEWWRHPQIHVTPPPVRSRFARFDTVEIQKATRRVEEELGLDDFTLVIDGKWNERHGDATPAEGFESLPGLIAEQHVKGRHVILRWEPFRAEPGSFARIVGIAPSGIVDATGGKRFLAYTAEVMRRCLADQLDSLGADGIRLEGLNEVRLPSALRDHPEKGVGLRELGLHLAELGRQVRANQVDALLLGRAAAPQFVSDLGGFVLDVSGVSAEERTARVEMIAAAIPDLPIFFEPVDEEGDALLRWMSRAAVIGVPALNVAQLGQLDDQEKRALGSLLAVSRQRRLGIPRRLEDGRWQTGFAGRRYAESLADDAGIVVYPDRDRALVVVTRAGDVPLPFEASSGIDDAEGATIEVTADGMILRDARPGRVYRLTRN